MGCWGAVVSDRRRTTSNERLSGMPYNIRIVSTYPPRRCGIGTFSRDLATALAHFTAEVGHIRVAALDNGSGPYDIPVDLVIDQRSPESWRNAIIHISTRAAEAKNPTVVILQHEFGLDPRFDGDAGSRLECAAHRAKPGTGETHASSFANLAHVFHEEGLITLVYLHTVPDEPGVHERATIQGLAEYSDGLVVTTESAIQILGSDTYGIPHERLKHIDHGVRMHHLSHYDRLAIKREYDLENRFLITTLGMLSPGKGIPYGIRAYGRFLEESCTEEQRQRMVYLIAGKAHPEFIRTSGGEPYRQFRATLAQALEQAKVAWCTVKELGGTNFDQYDVVFLDTFLDETTLLRLYGATNVMLLPYLNMQQISSGVLADTLGAGRVAITTKFRYARELLLSNQPCPEGLIIGRYARGILVDPGEPSVEQVAQALDYVVFNESKRLMMERQAHQRGYQMRWNNSAWALLQYIDFIREEREIVTGRGIKFIREKPSKLDIFKYKRIQVTPTVVAVSQEPKSGVKPEEVLSSKA
jgi:glycosyltransferase involved in cell wall biosynthesis